MVTNPSFEKDIGWDGIVYDNNESLIGDRSSKLSGTTISTSPMKSPTAGHKYYGRTYIKSTGDISASDNRFEMWGGDGYGLNWVFARNDGNFPQWTMQSSIQYVDAVNASSFIVRNFVVSAQNTCWTDGLMIVDLTESFGAGLEPTKEWCDEQIPFFEGSVQLELIIQTELTINNATIIPNPSVINSKATISIYIEELELQLVPYKIYSNDVFSGEV